MWKKGRWTPESPSSSEFSPRSSTLPAAFFSLNPVFRVALKVASHFPPPRHKTSLLLVQHWLDLRILVQILLPFVYLLSHFTNIVICNVEQFPDTAVRQKCAENWNYHHSRFCRHRTKTSRSLVLPPNSSKISHPTVFS